MASGSLTAVSDVQNSWAIHYGGGLYQAFRGDVPVYAYTDGGAIGICEFSDISGMPVGEGVASMTVNINYGNTNGSNSVCQLIKPDGTILAQTTLGDVGFDYDGDGNVTAHHASTTFTYTPAQPVSVALANQWRLRVQQTVVHQFSFFFTTNMTWTSGIMPASGYSMIL